MDVVMMSIANEHQELFLQKLGCATGCDKVECHTPCGFPMVMLFHMVHRLKMASNAMDLSPMKRVRRIDFLMTFHEGGRWGALVGKGGRMWVQLTNAC